MIFKNNDNHNDFNKLDNNKTYYIILGKTNIFVDIKIINYHCFCYDSNMKLIINGYSYV